MSKIETLLEDHKMVSEALDKAIRSIHRCERDNRNKDKEIVRIREENDSAWTAAEAMGAQLYTAIEQRDNAREIIDALLSKRPVVDDGETGVYCGYCQAMMGYCDPEDCVWERANQARDWIPSAGGSLRENSIE